MTCSRTGRIALPLCVLTGVAGLLLSGCGSTPGGSAGDLGAADLPLIDYGRYHFGPASANLTHPYCIASADTPDMTFAGYGDRAGVQMVLSFVYGNRVGGVQSLKATRTWPGNYQESDWMAQDSRGNIHYLKSRYGSGEPWYRGVIESGGSHACFALPRNANIAPGFAWYEWRYGSVKVAQSRVMSTTASFRGASNLLKVRVISDGNGDQEFDPSWSGPDNRMDFYYSPATHLLHGYQRSASGGYVRVP